MRIKARERWKLITHIDKIRYNFSRRYYISNYGRVKSVNDDKEKILKLNVNKGYYIIELACRDDDENPYRKVFQVNRLVCEYYCEYDEWITNYEVNHIDGDPSNNYYKNLELVSHADNMLHAKLNNLMCIGSNCYNSVIDEPKAHQICKLLSEDYKTERVAEILNVPLYIVRNIRKRNTWKHVSEGYIFPERNNPSVSEEQVHQICEYIKHGIKASHISKRLGISSGVIHDIKRKKTWKSVSTNYF